MCRPVPVERVEGVTREVAADDPAFAFGPEDDAPGAFSASPATSAFGLLSVVLTPRGSAEVARSPPLHRSSYQLPFKPKLAIHLLGGTERGDNPKLRAVLQARPKDANVARIQVTLPHSEFVEQGHFKTICTRVQFAAGQIPGEACAKHSIYDYARVFTPLLEAPIEGPVFLRSTATR